MSKSPKTPDKREQGLSLLDLTPLYKDIPYGDKSIRVYGISAEGCVAILRRFPEVRLWFKGGVKIDLQALAAEAPKALAAILAAGTGTPGNTKAEDMATRIGVETQLDLLEAIKGLTFSDGFGPFVKRIVEYVRLAESVNFGRAQVTTSPPPSNPPSLPAESPSPPPGP